MTATSIRPAYGLYPHQRQVVNDLMCYLEPETNADIGGDQRKVVAHLPTGAGKTRVAAHVASCLLNCSPHDDRGLIIWLASSAELCEQAAEELAHAWHFLGRWDGAVHRMWGNHETDVRWVSGGFLVASLQKLWSIGQRDRRPLIQLSSIASGVVFDEAHQAVAPTYRSMIAALLWENPPLLGLTATPGRSSIPGAEDIRLADIFDSNKVTIDARGHSNAIRFLIEGEYLAFPEFHHVTFETTTPDVTTPTDIDYGPNLLQSIGEDRRRFSQIVDLVDQLLRQHRRVMVFCPSVPNALTTHQQLTDRGLLAGVVTSETLSDERATIIESFRSDERTPMALLNYGVLTAGFDAPTTSCVLIARPTTSLVLYSQMVWPGNARQARRRK